MRVLRFLVNWLILLFLPLWGGCVLLGIFFYSLILEDDKALRGRAVGKDWIWK